MPATTAHGPWDSPEIPARRHCHDRSKPKSHRTGQTRHYSFAHAQGPDHVIFRSIDDDRENMVQGWLNNIQALGSGPIAGDPPHHTTSSSKHRPQSISPATWAPHALPLPHPLSRELGFASARSQPSGERQHERLRAAFNDRDDSSVIAPKGLGGSSRGRRPRMDSAAEASYHGRGVKRRRSSPEPEEGGSLTIPSPPDHNFEKRARHKTKSDRYDAVKNEVAGKEHRREKRKKHAAAEPKKDGTKRSHIASAREVMDNFNSQTILSNRITVRTPMPSSQARLIEFERCLLFYSQGCLTMAEYRRTQVSQERRPTADLLLTVCKSPISCFMRCLF